MVGALLTDEQSAYINFISKSIRPSGWKGRRRSAHGNVHAFQNEFFFSVPFLTHEYTRPKSVNFRIRFDLINVCLQGADC